MLKISLFLPLSLGVVMLLGCSTHNLRVDQGVVIDRESLTYLQQGLTQDQVRKLLGPPANQSSFNSQRWEYVFHSTQEKLMEDKVKQLVLNFDAQGYLSDWSTPPLK